jgi:hypothetical protein
VKRLAKVKEDYVKKLDEAAELYKQQLEKAKREIDSNVWRHKSFVFADPFVDLV